MRFLPWLIICLAPHFHQDSAKQPPLIDAIRKGDVAAAARLLESGANPNIRQILTSKPSFSEGIKGGRTSDGPTALDVAVDMQSLQLVGLLLNHKADPNARSNYGWTSLMTACQRRSLDIVKLLLHRGANPNLRNQYGDTAIVFAANTNSAGMVEALIGAGADMNGGTGQSALMMAAQSSAAATVKTLLKHGADPNFHRSGYDSPLEYAYCGYDEDVASMIRKAGGKGRTKAQLDKDHSARLAQLDKQWDAEKRASTKQNAAFAKLKAEDNGLIEAALVDMLQYNGKDFGFFERDKVKSLILVTESWAASGFEGWMNAELDERQANDIDLAMREDLLRRNASTVSLASFRLSDPRLALGKSWGEFDRNEAKAQGWVSAMLPGYSKDGTRAVLRFSFGPTPHGASGIYLLEKRMGKWVVVWRRFAYYA